MGIEETTQRAVAEIVRARGYDGPFEPELPLGSGGMGLDSIAIAEVLLACEERFRITVAAELLATESLTLGQLLECVRTSIAGQ